MTKSNHHSDHPGHIPELSTYIYLKSSVRRLSIFTLTFQVTDEYQRRLEDLLNVERHLLQAKAKALAEDERKLSSSTSLPSSDDIVLPNGPSQFHKLLNEELLSRHSLLSPSEYLPQPLAPRDAPKGTCMCMCRYHPDKRGSD